MNAPTGPVLAILYTLFVWWFATGGLFWLQRRLQGRPAPVLAIGAAAALGSLALARHASGSATSVGAAQAFTAAVGLWGANELVFLTGLVTGPSRAACPPDATGLDRFRRAAATLIFHEAALAGSAGLLALLAVGRPNAVAALTFLTLFLARLCAKMNLFVGVPSFSTGLFPERLRHLASYLRRRPVGGLLEASLAGLALVSGVEAGEAFASGASPFRATAFGLLFALTGLALIEHLFMLLPAPEALLWGWALPAPPSGDPAQTSAAAPTRRLRDHLRRAPKGASAHGL